MKPRLSDLQPYLALFRPYFWWLVSGMALAVATLTGSLGLLGLSGGFLTATGLAATQDWEWSVIPTVTATAKPAASPLAGEVSGGEASDATVCGRAGKDPFLGPGLLAGQQDLPHRNRP